MEHQSHGRRAEHFVFLNGVSPGYFETLHSPILAGRDIATTDTSESPRVAVINEKMAGRFFPNSNPIGKYFQIEEPPQGTSAPIQVIGVLKNAKYQSLREEFLSIAYFPVAQLKPQGPMMESPTFEVRTVARPSALAPAVAETITGVEKSVSLEFTTLAQQVDDSLTQDRVLATLSGFFGGLALLLAVVGLYGVLAYIVTQRQREIGIRMALGAVPGSILRLVMRDVAMVLAVGVAAGAALSVASTQFVQKMLFGLPPRDLSTISLSASVLVMVALVAGFIPARRAARTDPMVVLREE
jgi:predicted permease